MDVENNTQPTYQKNIFIEQFADSVVDYSSSFYNSTSSDTFAPKHIIGRPRFYPRYGNFAETYLLRAYGKWLTEMESMQKHYMPQDRENYESQNYITVQFRYAVIPTRIHIYETFNPGAIVRIWGGKDRGTWMLLWEGAPRRYTIQRNQKAVQFSPPLRPTQDLI